MALPYFVDWLIESVHLVEITAYSDGDAYTIFETMNDRGLSLTPADMLKGYLLASITDAEDRVHAGKVWKERISALMDLGKDEDADGIKSWLRSQYADTIRERKTGRRPRGLRPHRNRVSSLGPGPRRSAGLGEEQRLCSLYRPGLCLLQSLVRTSPKAAETFTPGLECVYFNAEHNFTLQYPVLLSPLQVTGLRRTRSLQSSGHAAFLDILIHRRIWNWHAIDYSTMQYAMFIIMRDIRGKEH